MDLSERQEMATMSSSLPPTDRGKDAWLLLAGAFVLEALVWGFAFSYGVFQEYYTALEIFRGQEFQIPVVGTISSGLMYLCSPIALPLCRRYSHRRRQGMLAGLVITCGSFIGASFARNAGDLIATQGVLFGIGASMVYYPVFLFIDEWFVVRKGLAYGIAWASSGLSGVVLPYILSWSLRRYSFRITLRWWAAANLALISATLPFLKPRLPPTPTGQYRWPSFSFATQPLFIAFCLGTLIQSLGQFLPGIYLPSYARAVGFNNAVAATTVALLNIGSCLGCITGGLLCDRWSTRNVVVFSTIGTTTGSAFLWGLTSSPATLASFSLLYGYFSGYFVAAWPGLVNYLVGKDPTQTAEPTTMYVFFIAARGIGSIISAPLSQGLLHLPKVTEDFSYGYGSMYGALILFAAITNFFSGIGPFFEALTKLKKIWTRHSSRT